VLWGKFLTRKTNFSIDLISVLRFPIGTFFKKIEIEENGNCVKQLNKKGMLLFKIQRDKNKLNEFKKICREKKLNPVIDFEKIVSLLREEN